MSGLNGRANGQHPAEAGGIGGPSLLEGLDSKYHQRETIHMLRRRMNAGAAVKEEWIEPIMARLAVIVKTSEHERNVIAAAKALMEQLSASAEAAIALDKIERLDGGYATENVALSKVYEVEFDRRG